MSPLIWLYNIYKLFSSNPSVFPELLLYSCPWTNVLTLTLVFCSITWPGPKTTWSLSLPALWLAGHKFWLCLWTKALDTRLFLWHHYNSLLTSLFHYDFVTSVMMYATDLSEKTCLYKMGVIPLLYQLQTSLYDEALKIIKKIFFTCWIPEISMTQISVPSSYCKEGGDKYHWPKVLSHAMATQRV